MSTSLQWSSTYSSSVYSFYEMVFKVNISLIFINLAPLDLRNVFSENLTHIVGMHWKPTIKNGFIPIQELILDSGSVDLFTVSPPLLFLTGFFSR